MKKVFCITIILLKCIFLNQLFANDYLFDSTYAFNGNIKSIYSHNGVNYIGGNFTKISYVSGYGTTVSTLDGTFSNNMPKINGRVNVAIPDGNGGFYIGGEFSKISNYERLGLAHIDANGQLTSFAPKVNMGFYPFVNDIILYSNKLYVAGSFEGINNTERKYLACLDLNGNLTSWNPIVNDEVFTLSAYNNNIYFGGNFTSVNGIARYFGASVSVNGSINDWNPQANNIINTIKTYKGKIYLGGSFTKIQNTTANRFAIMYPDGSLENLSLSFNNAVDAINFYQEKVYVGGRFTKVNNTYRNYLVALDTNGSISNWNPNPNAKVSVVDCDSNGVYIGGSFSLVANQVRSSFAYISHSGNLTNWNPNANSTGLTIAQSNSNVFIGGIFNGLGGFDRNYLVAIDTLGQILDWNPNPNNEIYSIFGDSSSVFISGSFSKVGNINISKFATINGITGELTDFRPTINGYTYSMLFFKDRIILAGSFSKINNQNRYNIAAFDRNGNLLDFAPEFNSSIFAMDNDGANIYVGGFFTQINGQDRNMIACIDTAGNLAAFNPIVDNAIISLKYLKDKIYIGGWFNNVMGSPRSKFAVINKNGTLSPLAPNPNNTIWSILTFTKPFDVVYLGGDFSTIFNQPLKNLVAIDANGGLIPWYPNPDKTVYTLSSSGSQVYAGGLFSAIDNTLSPNFAILHTYYISPGQPTLISPIDNSTKVQVLSRFDWTATEYTSSYRVQFSTNTTFTNLVLDTIIPINYLAFDNIKLLYNTKHYWRVRSLNSEGQSAWSTAWAFTTRIAPPLAPILLTPLNSTIDIAYGQLFSWDASATTAESFQIQYSTDNTFSNIVSSDSAIHQSSISIPDDLLQPLQTYWWRVRGINESGPGEWTNSWYFTTAEFFTQNIALKAGWNLISSNILPVNDSLEKIFENVADKILIIKNGSGKVYIPQFGINSIGKWNKLDGYRVYSLAATSLNILGYMINPSTSTYSLKAGWNQISYIRSSEMIANDAFQSLVDMDLLSIVKDEKGKTYIPEYGINQIGNLIPGRSYIIYVKAATNFNYPANN
ncbi:MAG TPA: hypothetical protein PLE30_00105 [Candidatus Kapabacteria bacterium]|nr:hypothetical protein [Candidatus Kapabacteria bacterium]